MCRLAFTNSGNSSDDDDDDDDDDDHKLVSKLVFYAHSTGAVISGR